VTDTQPRARTALERALAAYPLVAAYVTLLVLYAWQTTRHSTPWLFTDELEWAGKSRGVAHHGVPQLRLHDASFTSLYAYVIAPFWWLGSTDHVYAAIKYANAAIMAASLFPAYALARPFVSRPAAVVCGIATASIPSLAYSSFLIPEPLAYLWSTIALWLIVRALLRPTRATVAVGAVSVLLAPLVRSQLQVLIVAGLIAAGIFAATGPRGRRRIATWTWQERVGAVVLLIGAAVFLGAFANHHSFSWQIGTHYHDRVFTYGLWAFGAFAIGVGVLPAFATIAWLAGTRFAEPAERALASVTIGAIVAFGLYTAVKASYISATFAIRVEERNLIYIAPVVFAVTARWLLTGRARVVPVAVAAACVGYLLWTTPYHNNEKFYSDAPGLSNLQWFNRTWAFTTTDAKRLLFAILVVTVVVAFVKRRAVTVVAALLAVLAVAWNLTGEIAAANASNEFSDSFRGVLPTPPDWIDRATGRARTMFIGRSMQGSNAFWSLEFWNQSIGDVWSVDSTAPGPGPVTTPNYLDTTGAVDPQLPLSWVVASPGVDPAGTLRQTVGGLRLYHVSRPIRIKDAEGLVTPDGWMTNAAWYYHFAPAGRRRGTAVVTMSRSAACGDFAPSRITIRVSRLRIDANGQPAAGKLLAVRHATVHSNPCESKAVRIPVAPPFRIDVSANGTFQPSEFDPRQLSAQVGFGFER
jgi:hypothetical protein